MSDDTESFRYLGVRCQDKLIPLWDTSSEPASVPADSDRPITIEQCPGCHREHTFLPEELRLWESPWRLEIRRFR
jgi:hypothetical protein